MIAPVRLVILRERYAYRNASDEDNQRSDARSHGEDSPCEPGVGEHEAVQLSAISFHLSSYYQAQAYASTRGSAPALSTPFAPTTIAPFEPCDHAPVTRSLWPRAVSA